MKRICIIIFAAILLLLLCSCTHTPAFRQSAENIVSIELVNYFGDEAAVVCTLRGEEVGIFMERLSALECHKHFMDPRGDFGALEIWVHYANSDVDIIGTGCDGYIEQGNLVISGWYYYDEIDLHTLFALYVDESKLPPLE